jgi:hypothetical protein
VLPNPRSTIIARVGLAKPLFLDADLEELSVGDAAGISTDVSWSVSHALGIGALVLATGCDVRALQQYELMPAMDAAADDTRPDAATMADVSNADGSGRRDVRIARMLSGSVIDACTGRGTDARVGIAGRRQCSVALKGSYYFHNLPEGNLALIAFKEGYQHFEVAVSITSEGTIQDIVLQPDTPHGCADPRPVDVACECNIPGCL